MMSLPADEGRSEREEREEERGKNE